VSYRIELLDDGHDLEGFTCGQPELDTWLTRHARNATRQGTRTYVMIEETSGELTGYFAIAPYLVAREQAPRSVGRGALQRIPAILLAKLALDERLHGQGLGSELLVHALTTIIAAARSAGGRVVVVDAIDDTAVSFYQAHDFQPSPTSPDRLVLKLSTAARALGLSWP
jgi:GNAT superfamily N-acetyltransferase